MAEKTTPPPSERTFLAGCEHAAAWVKAGEPGALWLNVDVVAFVKPLRGHRKVKHYRLGWNGERLARTAESEHLERRYPEAFSWLTRALKDGATLTCA